MNQTPSNDLRRGLANARRIVVKIGTNVLADKRRGLDERRIERLADQICAIRSGGRWVTVVSSGAIGAGMAALGMKARPKALPKLQAAAAIGQSRLMGIYGRSFERHGYHAAQILLTREDFQDFNRYLNIRRTFAALNRLGAIPIINENDTTAVEEITFGDNDQLAALVTSAFQADLLILLSTIDGLYDQDGRVIGQVADVTEKVRGLSFGKVSSLGVGGMDSKLEAIKMATDFGEPVVLANGKQDDILSQILSGQPVGTLFLPAGRRMQGRKRWLVFGGKTKGQLWIDDGAARAVTRHGKSLLPSGVVKVTGKFDAGDIVAISDLEGRLLGKGKVAFSSEEASKLCGAHTHQIKTLLGRDADDELVHRDDLVLLPSAANKNARG